MQKYNNTCKFVDIYDTQPHFGVKNGGIVTNVYSASSIFDGKVYEFIGRKSEEVLEYALAKFHGCNWDSAFNEFILDLEKEKIPKDYEIVHF